MPRPRTGIMLAKPFEQRLLDRMPGHIIVQPKLDGVRARAVWFEQANTYQLYSSTGLLMTSLPHIIDALNDMASVAGRCPSFDGEVFQLGMKEQEIQSITSKTTCVDEYAWMVDYHIFDIVAVENTQEERSFSLTQDFTQVVSCTDHIQLVPSFHIGKPAWPIYLNRFVSEGYEGVIIRNPQAIYQFGKKNCILKVKPNKIDEYKILSCEQAISIGGDPKGMVGAFNLIDSLGNHFQASAGRLTHPERIEWWERRNELPGKICVVRYLTLTERGVPREPVTMEIKDAQ